MPISGIFVRCMYGIVQLQFCLTLTHTGSGLIVLRSRQYDFGEETPDVCRNLPALFGKGAGATLST